MRRVLIVIVTAVCQGVSVPAQTNATGPAKSPMYEVTVVARTTTAVSYQYRAGATKIQFRGTVLLPAGKGEATVEAQRGRTEIQAELENLVPPTEYGPQYLTYTLWAITPQGGAHNLAEVIPDGSNKARIQVTTDLQAFGLIVTAEPYSAVHQPSDVVVMENEVRPDTIGEIKTIQAHYELLPRDRYTWNIPAGAPPEAPRAKVSMAKYEQQLAIYEARNAIGMARAANASAYARDTIDKAETQLEEAERLQAAKVQSGIVVQHAREATQTAEDARLIAERRAEEEKVAAAQLEAARAQDALRQARDEASRAEAAAATARAQSEADRTALQEAEQAAAAERQRVIQAEAVSARAVPGPAPQVQQKAREAEYRMRLLKQLDEVLPTRDTPRGLVVTVGDAAFHGTELTAPVRAQVARLGDLLASEPRLQIDIEGHTDNPATSAVSWGRAETVERILIGHGLAKGSVTAHDLGASRPVGPNSSPAGREQNRRVEIVISGDPIGTLAYWDRTYSLMQRQ